MNVGGPARQIIELAKGLAPRGFDTILASGHPDAWEGSLLDAARGCHAEIVHIPGLGARVNPADDARAFAALVKLLRSRKPDIVHTHTAKAGALGRVAARFAPRGKRVHTFHGTVFNHYFSAAKSNWIMRVERMLAKSTDRIVAVSHAVADEIERIGVDAEKIRVIEPVIDLAPFLTIENRAGGLRRELNITDDQKLIGWVGRFVNIKNPAAFVEAAALAAANHPKARFVMIGAGPLEQETRALAAKLGLAEKIHFAGLRADMEHAYADLDILVNTSEKEGMPVSVLEAMAAGVVVVATNVGGTGELVAEDRSGWLVEPGDTAAVARSIGRWFEFPKAWRETMRGVARVRASEKFGLERGLARHEQMYRELLGR